MFISRLMTAGYLLAFSTVAAAETQSRSAQNHPNTPTPTVSQPSSYTLPQSCYTTFEDFRYHRTRVLTHSCYTRTSFFPAGPCPTLSCPRASTGHVCPLYIKVSTVTVPCATDCCPTTSTAYEPDNSAPCPTCDPCLIPTEWITYTTGCVGTSTITEINVVTPAYPG
ncbi:hypothetical protein F4824DRAFT_499018 [Ustulina deusta]|nr:hypothetical protein F4824DRAFT_499018 [Ustulina deusta]